jgi:xylan 1,4-beta-xylosidase
MRTDLLSLALGISLFGLFPDGSAQKGTEPAWTNPVLAGDHPDPSVIRVGAEFWSTNTSGERSPQFPLFRSRDLVHWSAAGAVFQEKPRWAKGSFWAPELIADKGRYLVYYAARKIDGPLCVAVATASAPQGPYLDRGPLVCQDDGSIDAAFIRDEKGSPYLIWKEDGNSIHRPTPIWAQPLSDDLVHLKGNKTLLIINEPSSWEGGVVEGPYILRHKERFYLFYAGNACCGVDCHYAEGVARADRLLGPWEKDPANPIIAHNDEWKCPGHGSIVQDREGRDYLLYHAYPQKGSVNIGREGLLDRILWGADGWPTVNGGRGPSTIVPFTNSTPATPLK